MIYSVPDHVFYGKPLLLKCIKKIGGGRGLKKISQRGGLVRINFLQVNFWKVYVSSVRMFFGEVYPTNTHLFNQVENGERRSYSCTM